MDGVVVTDPRAGIANVEVIAAFGGRVPGASLARDVLPEGALLPLELARRIAGFDPVGDFARLLVGQKCVLCGIA